MNKEELLQACMSFHDDKGYLPELEELNIQKSIELPNGIKATDDIFIFYFEELLGQIRDQETEDLDISLTFGEQFSQFIFQSIDLLSTHKPFSISCVKWSSSSLFFSSKIEHLLKEELEDYVKLDDAVTSVAHLVIGDLFFKQMIADWEGFVLHGLEEDIPSEQLLERVDKYTQLLDALLHNDIPEKSFNYLKTLYQQGEFSLKKLLF